MHLHFSTTFGFENVYPLLVEEGQALHGHQYLGSKGLLEWLELHLGITKIDVKDAIRVMHYQKTIEAMRDSAEHTDLYIWASFEKDSWKASTRLLQWRDELVLANYKFDCKDESLERLYALSCIEEKLDGELPLGVNDRWLASYKHIRQSKRKWEHTLKLYEPISLMHPFFTELFTALEKLGLRIEECLSSYRPNVETDLGKVQAKFCNPTDKEKVNLKGDGSLTILTADSESLLAESLAQYYGEYGTASSVLIVQERGELLEDAFAKRNVPSMGYQSSIENGGLDQLFSLFSLFLWKPFNPELLMQYLTLPKTLLHPKLQTALSKVYATKQGVGNKDWNEELEKFLKESKDAKKEQVVYDSLFKRKKYFEENKGAEADSIADLYDLLGSWAKNQMKSGNEEKRRIFDRLKNKCDQFVDLLKLESEGKNILIQEQKLKRWQEAIHDGDLLRVSKAEVGHPFYVKHPGNICRKAEKVIWWNFIESSNPLSRYNDWDVEELQVLKNSWLYKKEKIISSWYWKMKHALLMANAKLILCIPKKKKGEITEANPLLNDLKAWIENIELVCNEIDILSDSISLDEIEFPFEHIEKSDLPVQEIYWELNGGLLKQFKKSYPESYSSLEKLVNYPDQYVLKYLLGIKAQAIPEINVSSLLKGNVAHKLVEEVFGDEKSIKLPQQKFKKVLTTQLEKLIEKEASIFLLKKNQVLLEAYKPKVISSLLYLKQLIVDNDWEVFKQELELEDDLTKKMRLKGYVDLILKKGNHYLIVDLKWGGLSRRQEELINKEDLQLVIYYELMKRKFPKAKIDMAYYIINQESMLSRSPGLFSGIDAISDGKEEIEMRASTWRKLLNSIEVRFQEFEEGKVESGEGMFASNFDGPLWNKEEDFLKVKTRGRGTKFKKEDIYSDYKKFIKQ